MPPFRPSLVESWVSDSSPRNNTCYTSYSHYDRRSEISNDEQAEVVVEVFRFPVNVTHGSSGVAGISEGKDLCGKPITTYLTKLIKKKNQVPSPRK